MNVSSFTFNRVLNKDEEFKMMYDVVAYRMYLTEFELALKEINFKGRSKIVNSMRSNYSGRVGRTDQDRAESIDTLLTHMSIEEWFSLFVAGAYCGVNALSDALPQGVSINLSFLAHDRLY